MSELQRGLAVAARWLAEFEGQAPELACVEVCPVFDDQVTIQIQGYGVDLVAVVAEWAHVVGVDIVATTREDRVTVEVVTDVADPGGVVRVRLYQHWRLPELARLARWGLWEQMPPVGETVRLAPERVLAAARSESAGRLAAAS
ncbi:hypothetical protein [Actinokineospora inagensis]|uniref:hypothetical protein n=1 Tax=Actinokineospora inagensis TaxID=103730 RepID=UPI0012F84BBD|nr:hypothetical protein [Actinokineospora inagensis]